MDKWRELSTGSDVPRVVHAVIENPQRTENKYEYDVDKRAIVLDRVLHTAVHYRGITDLFLKPMMKTVIRWTSWYWLLTPLSPVAY